MKYLSLLTFLIVSFHCYSQTDTVSKQGTIKIVKARDSIYIKAFAEFKVFELEYKKNGSSPNAVEKAFDKMLLAINQGYSDPKPSLNDSSIQFDYSSFFNQINRKEINLGEKNCDTVEIRIDITYDGKVYCRDLKTQMRLANNILKYDKKLNGYKNSSFSTHFSSFNRIKSIEKWTPAKAMVSKQSHFRIIFGKLNRKDKTSEKRKRKLVPQATNSSGIITIIFSKEEISE